MTVRSVGLHCIGELTDAENLGRQVAAELGGSGRRRAGGQVADPVLRDRVRRPEWETSR